MRFQGKAVVVTGGSKGIGEGCSRVFCREGGLVAILARGKAAGEALAAELSKAGPGRAIYISCDVSDCDQLKSAIDKQDPKAFDAAYRQAMNECYACHKLAEKPYLRPHIPEAPATRMIDVRPNAN